MGQRNKKRVNQSGRSAAGGERHDQSTESNGGAGVRRYALWALLVVVVVAGVAGVWLVQKGESPSTAASSAVHQPPAALPLAALEPTVEEAATELGPSTPRLAIPETEFDFGYVPQKAKISHDFWLHSTGTDTLRIVKVSPG